MNKVILISLVALMLFSVSCNWFNESQQNFQQSFSQGYMLYQQRCQNCHKKDGNGFKELYPPINKADYLKQKDKVACILKYGANEEMTINGVKYQLPMPGNKDLHSSQIAQIMTYIYNAWDNDLNKTFTGEEIENYLSNCDSSNTNS